MSSFKNMDGSFRVVSHGIHKHTREKFHQCNSNLDEEVWERKKTYWKHLNIWSALHFSKIECCCNLCYGWNGPQLSSKNSGLREQINLGLCKGNKTHYDLLLLTYPGSFPLSSSNLRNIKKFSTSGVWSSQSTPPCQILPCTCCSFFPEGP